MSFLICGVLEAFSGIYSFVLNLFLESDCRFVFKCDLFYLRPLFGSCFYRDVKNISISDSSLFLVSSEGITL